MKVERSRVLYSLIAIFQAPRWVVHTIDHNFTPALRCICNDRRQYGVAVRPVSTKRIVVINTQRAL